MTPAPPRPPELPDDTAPLTWAQQLIWAGQAQDRTTPLYNMALAYRISGPLDPERFERAWQKTVRSTDALRLVFQEGDAGPIQRVRADMPASVVRVDLADVDDAAGAADRWCDERAARTLPLSDRPWDCALLRLGPEDHVWFINQHHLITDGWSTGLLFRRVAEAYEEGAVSGSTPAFLDHARRTAHQSAEASRSHWEDVAGGLEPAPLYGRDRSRTGTRTTRRTVDLGRERTEALKRLAATPEARALTPDLSAFNVWAALVTAFIHRVSGREDLALGAPAHGRTSRDARDTVGLFIETFPLVVPSARAGELHDLPFQELLADVRDASMGFLRHARPGASSPAATRATNVVLNYIHAVTGAFAGLTTQTRWVHPGHGDRAHDLRVQVHDLDGSGSLKVHLDWSEEVLSAGEQVAASAQFLRFVDAVLRDPAVALGDLELLEDGERARLTRVLGRPDVPFQPPKRTFVSLFQERVAAAPDSVALEAGARAWTYAELDACARDLAGRLRAEGATGRRVGLAMGRCPEAVVGLLGVAMAGASWVSLDPDHPPERLRSILEESGVAFLITEPGAQPGGPLGGLVAFQVNLDVPSRTPPPSGQHGAAGLDDEAYVLYTSGSTGRPKGVSVSHRSLACYAAWAADTYLEGPDSAFAFFTPLTFDLTLTSILAPLLGGGRVVVVPRGTGPVDDALLRIADEGRVDIAKVTPSHLELLRGRELGHSRLKTLIVGGEDLTVATAQAAREALGGATLFNEYGPTEGTVACTLHEWDPGHDTRGSVPIGRPLADARIYIVDDRMRLAPPGVPGEIVVGGSGVANGYVRPPEGTSDPFGADPFVPGGRIYRTGDRGRWRPDGVLEFLGRSDRQIKVHGMRVELGEIESVMADHPDIDRAAVAWVEPPRRVLTDRPDRHCARCGLPSEHPEAHLEADGVCTLCHAFDGYRDRAMRYFGSLGELEGIMEQARARRTGDYDCLMLLSGGKDSTYALYRLVDMGLDVLAVTLDNGFISEGAKANVRRVTRTLEVDHEFHTVDRMNEIFVDSLKRFSNVCQGCFKTMYTLAVNTAVERGIPTVVTGLSRGQFFETRLTEELFSDPDVRAEDIDDVVLEARKAYHRVDDAVLRVLDTRRFQEDAVFDQVQFVDFYRYCDVGLGEMLAFLEAHPWVRPEDTGRSTNCLINDVGIYVHRLERGYHNYAFPYSWDVRLGHKERAAALEELDDEFDLDRVRAILAEIGYPDPGAPGDGAGRLVAFYEGDPSLGTEDIRSFLRERLPAHMLPADVHHREHFPLTGHGKVDMAALTTASTSGGRSGGSGTFVEPSTQEEAALARVWRQVLGLERIGVSDNFFEVGGDSISAIQIAAQARRVGLDLNANAVFQHQTIAGLAASLGASIPLPEPAAGNGDEAPQDAPGDPDFDDALPELATASEWAQVADLLAGNEDPGGG